MARNTAAMEPLERVLATVGRGSVPPILATKFDPALGEDLVGRDRLVRDVRAVLLGDSPAVFGETSFSAPTVDLVELMDAAREISLIVPRRLVIVRGSRLAGGGEDTGAEDEGPGPDARTNAGRRPPARGNADVEPERDEDGLRIAALERYLAGAGASACILFVGCPWDARRRVHKAVLARSTVVDVSRPDAKAAPAWIQEFAKREGARIEPEAASILAELRGNDTMRLAGEIEKLRLHAGPSGTIGRAHVLALVGAGEAPSAWAVGDALVDGDAERGIRAIRDLLAEGHAPPMIVGAIASRLRQLVVLRDEKAVGRVNDAARKVVFPGRSIYFADAMGRKVGRFPMHTFTEALASLYHVDRRCKSSSIDPGVLLDEWLLATLKSFESVRS